MAELGFEPRTEWIKSYALLFSSTLLLKIYSMNVTVESKWKSLPKRKKHARVTAKIKQQKNFEENN